MIFLDRATSDRAPSTVKRRRVRSRLRLLVAGACLWLAGVLPASVNAAECAPPARQPSFEIRVGSPAVTYDFTQDRPAMTKLAVDGSVRVGKGHSPVGLTITGYDFTVTTETDTIHSDDVYCASLRSVVVNLGIKVLKVLVDRRYAAGSCEQETILEHEHKHVEITREAPRYYAREVSEKVEAMLRPRVLRLASLEEARTVFAPMIRTELQPLFQAIRDRAAQRNAQLDEQEGDARKLHRCERW
jgi:hypothetical protein